MPSKLEIRREIRQARDAIDPQSRAASARQIRTQLLDLPAIRGLNSWFIYVSAGSEVETHELIRTLLARADIVTVPRVVGADRMIPVRIKSFDELRLGEFGILAPASSEPHQGHIDICVCPGVAFTALGERLGSGRGFFDRFLAVHSYELVIGLAYESQMVQELPQESHDRRMNFIITENRLIET